MRPEEDNKLFFFFSSLNKYILFKFSTAYSMNSILLIQNFYSINNLLMLMNNTLFPDNNLFPVKLRIARPAD